MKGDTFGKASDIDSNASAYVIQQFASGWVRRPRIPDYYIDHDIERIEAGEPSGKIFYAQQKGHEKVEFKNGLTIQKLKTKHLRYFDEKIVVPVFLFLIDVTNKIGYYLFLQEWIDKHANIKNCRN